ncbi:MAG: c-type cytochrome [Chitinophagaceae bacterium]
MHRLLRWLEYLLLLVVLGLICFFSYILYFLPNVGPAPSLEIRSTPARLARGAYLCNHVCGCVDCHSRRNMTIWGGPVEPGTLGEGGETFNKQEGLPGTFISPNITPYGIGQWTDGEVFRAITAGEDRGGKALFPIMPYLNFGQLDTADIYAIISYIRTLPAIPSHWSASHADFPMDIIIHTLPQRPDFHPIPPPSDSLDYGKYLFTAANCNECHTPKIKGQPMPGLRLAGGMVFRFPDGDLVRSANITPDLTTGIGSWSKAVFIDRFKQYQNKKLDSTAVHPGEFQTVMPWMDFSGMTTADLGAIYAYLRTIPPVHHLVRHFTAMGKK